MARQGRTSCVFIPGCDWIDPTPAEASICTGRIAEAKIVAVDSGGHRCDSYRHCGCSHRSRLNVDKRTCGDHEVAVATETARIVKPTPDPSARWLGWQQQHSCNQE
jgi:hypothetical protein